MSDSTRSYLYKNQDKDFESLRRQRQDHSIELRKNKKNESLQKKRNIQIELTDDSSAKENVSSNIELLCKGMYSPNSAARFQSVVECRKLLSLKYDPPISEFCKHGAVYGLINIMKQRENDEIIFEAAWALTNIVSGDSEHTAKVVQADGINLFISFFSHNNDQIVEQCVWALSNIVGDCTEYRNMTFKQDIINHLITIIKRFWDKNDILRNVAWLISNLCRHKTTDYPVEQVRELMPIIREMILFKSTDIHIVSDLCWGLSYAADNDSSLIDTIIKEGLLNFVVGLLNNSELAAPALRLLGNLVAGTNEQTEAAVNVGVIDGIRSILENSRSEARLIKECCWVLSNIAAGTVSQVQKLLNTPRLLSIVLRILRGDVQNSDHKAQKEAAWVIGNLAASQGVDVVAIRMQLIKEGALESTVPLLTAGEDAPTLLLILDCVKDLLSAAAKNGCLDEAMSAFEEASGVDAVEKLQEHESKEVYNRSYRLVVDFFGVEDDDDVPYVPTAEEEIALQRFEF